LSDALSLGVLFQMMLIRVMADDGVGRLMLPTGPSHASGREKVEVETTSSERAMAENTP
jgi:hypothetical protein